LKQFTILPCDDADRLRSQLLELRNNKPITTDEDLQEFLSRLRFNLPKLFNYLLLVPKYTSIRRKKYKLNVMRFTTEEPIAIQDSLAL